MPKTAKKAKVTDPRTKQAIDGFCQRYHNVTGKPYVTGAKDAASVKRLLGQLDQQGDADALATIKAAAEAMFRDDWARPKASLALLCGTLFNKWRPCTAVTSKRDHELKGWQDEVDRWTRPSTSV